MIQALVAQSKSYNLIDLCGSFGIAPLLRRAFNNETVRPAIIAVEDYAMFIRIVSDPAILGGKPCVRGTRISVEFILELVASGASRDDIVKSYPHLTAEDVEEALNFAAQSFSNETIMTAEVPS